MKSLNGMKPWPALGMPLSPKASSLPIEASTSHNIGEIKSKKICLLDWDDSLLCSTALRDGAVDTTPLLPAIEERVIALFTALMACGYELNIITGAEQGWVELSGSRYLPGVLQFIKLHKIEVISACNRYKFAYPNDPLVWKKKCFVDVCNKACGRQFLPPSRTRNKFMRNWESSPRPPSPECEISEVLSLGDSPAEFIAAKTLSESFPETAIKIVKFIDRPSAKTLLTELDTVLQYISHVALRVGSYEVIFSDVKSVPEPVAAARLDPISVTG